MSISLGAKFGPYQIVEPLGAGGMGEVYRARDTRLDRDVAVKVLPAHLTKNVEFKQRFEREAKSISQLTHPNICTLHDVGQHDGVDFLVMELLDGETLAQRLIKGPLPPDQVLRIGVEMASALDAAHRKGIIHRDLKPGNVMLARTGAKLLDFGLAKGAVAVGGDSGAVTVSQPLTSKGTLLGTFQYMSPEQLEGQEADARTDIFALGAVLYEMTTGKRAFEGASRASLIASIMTAQPRAVSELQPMTPPALDRLIRKSLAKDPDARWQSAADVADELRWLGEGGSQTGVWKVAENVRTRRFFPAWVIAGLFAAAAVFAWTWRPTPHADLSSHLSIVLPETDVVDGGLENLALAVSPDGRSIAYCGRGNEGIHLYHRRLDQRAATKLPGTEGAYDPFFSPDGRWIGFFSGQKMRKVLLQGGASIPIADSLESRAATWIDDATIAFSPTFGDPVMWVSPGGGSPEPITELQKDRRERTHRWPDAFPGGEWVLFTVGTVDSPGGYDEANIEAVSLKTRERRLLIKGGRMARFAPPNFLIFARKDVLFAVPTDPADPRVTEAPIPVLDGVGGEDTSGASHFDISSEGTLIYLPGSSDVLDELVWVDRAGKVEPIGAPQRLYDHVRLSPDGKQVLLTIGPARGSGDIWRFDIARGTMSRLTFDQKSTSPHWMPDQKRMVYRTEEGEYRIMVQPLDGSEPPRIIHRGSFPILVSGVSPDGSAVLYQKYGSGDSDVLIAPVDGSAPGHPLWEEQGAQYSAMISPDGRWLAYVSQESGEDEVFIRPASGVGGIWQISTDGGLVPLWSPDGKEVFFVNGDTMMSVPIEFAEGQVIPSAPKKLFDIPPGRRSERDLRSFDITPDGSRFILLRSAALGLGRRSINIVLNWTEELKSRFADRQSP